MIVSRSLADDRLPTDFAAVPARGSVDSYDFSLAMKTTLNGSAQCANVRQRRCRTPFNRRMFSKRSGFFQKPDDGEQHDGAQGGHDQRTDQSVRLEPDKPEQNAAEKGADDTDDDVADESETAALHNRAGNPSGDSPDDQKADETETLHVIAPAADHRCTLYK